MLPPPFPPVNAREFRVSFRVLANYDLWFLEGKGKVVKPGLLRV
jgi:hypothetical protein